MKMADETQTSQPEIRDNSGRFKPGHSGNPGGRPKKTMLTDAFEEMLDLKLSDPIQRQRFIEAHWEKLLSKTVVSSMTLEKILDRTEGKVSQPVQVSGDLKVSLAEELQKADERVHRIKNSE